MKKLAVLILVLGLVVVSCGKKEETVSVAPVAVESVVAEVAKPVVAVEKGKVTSITGIVSLDSYNTHRNAGKSLESAGKFLEASDEFVKSAEEAEKLVGKIEYQTGSPEQSQAWQLNSAALCIIEQHKKDKTGNLNKSKELLDKAFALKDVHLDCVAKIKSNLNYCDYYMILKSPPVRGRGWIETLKEQEKNKK